MTTPANYWKLGLFVVAGSLVGLSLVLLLVARSLRRETVTYRSYFDEAVSGLEVGSMVSFRGVRVGRVSAIQVAPDRRRVETIFELDTEVLTHLGLARKKGLTVEIHVPPDLRVQLSTTSITGNKYLRLDFFDPQRNPPPALPFEPGPNYIPAAESTLKNLENSVLAAVERVPELVADMKQILLHTQAVLVDLRNKELPERAARLLDRTDHLMEVLERVVTDLRTKELSAQARVTLASLDQTLGDVRKLMAKAGRDGGVVDGLERASNAVGDLAQRATPASGELEETLRSLRNMADSVQRLTDALERDSDMLLKGRATEKTR